MEQAPKNRRYIAVKFRPEDGRSYTYHYDGDEQFEAGDEVSVPDRRGDGRKRVYIAFAADSKPPFDTKPILGRAEPKNDEQEQEL